MQAESLRRRLLSFLGGRRFWVAGHRCAYAHRTLGEDSCPASRGRGPAMT